MQTRNRPRRRGSLVRWVLVAALVIDGLALGLAAGVYATVSPLVPDAAKLGAYQPNQTTRIYARNGELLASLFEENRQVVEIAQMPKWLVQATTAIEDQRFVEHPGVDPIGIARAIKVNLSGGSLQGASTITQQLAREVFLGNEKSDRTKIRKLKEMTLAVRMERRYSKEEILGLYMNQICYGHRAYGVVAAADTLFGKKLPELTLAECALIAGLAKNPAGYSPIAFPERSKQRRDTVLFKMRELGLITGPQCDQATSEPIKTRSKNSEPWKIKNYRAPWFTTYVIDQLVAKLGHDKVYGGGLQVYTTIDLELQAYAQSVLSEALRGLERKRANRGAIVVMDPRDGSIMAMVGGDDFSRDEFNAATQAYRQPGSAFKPIVYTTAMETIGLNPGDVYSASPATFKGYWGVYTPQNFSANQGGMMTVQNALAQSCNLVAVRVIIRTGPQNVVEQAHRMGIDQQNRRLRAFPSLALGANEVSPLELTSAYCAFANGGNRVEPYCIERVAGSNFGSVLRQTPQLTPVMSSRTYWNMNQMLRGVVDHGTGRPAQISSPVGGKTGTTNQAKDVWFLGFTPGMTCAVWLGSEENVRMWGASGAAFCAPIWRKIALKCRELQRDRGKPWPEAFPSPNGDSADLAVSTVSESTAAAQAAEEKAAEEGKGPTATVVEPKAKPEAGGGETDPLPGGPPRDSGPTAIKPTLKPDDTPRPEHPKPIDVGPGDDHPKTPKPPKPDSTKPDKGPKPTEAEAPDP